MDLGNFLFVISFFLHRLTPITTTSIPPFPKKALPTKSGHLPVNSTTGSAIFYAFYEAQNPNSPLSQTPLIIWLQGGPGCSSMLGNFYELGPWRVSRKQNAEHLVLEPNSGSWNRIFGLLFLDNPIGVGFSIASTPQEIPTDQHGIAKHLYLAILRFLALNPLFKSRPIYIAGESYAGKYCPSIGYYTLKKNSRLPLSRRLNLAGIAIGNGFTDPVIQLTTHADHAYFCGFINEKQKSQLEKLQAETVKITRTRNWIAARNSRTKLITTLGEMTGLPSLHDYRRRTPYEVDMIAEFLNQSKAKKWLGVNESFAYEICNRVVSAALQGDVMKSAKQMVEYVVKNIKVLLYQGRTDMRDSVVATEAWVKTMKWEGIGRFLEAEKRVWRVDEVVAGYVQNWGRLSHVVVLGAGHMVPADQPVNSQRMIEDWVLDEGEFANAKNESSSHGLKRNKQMK